MNGATAILRLIRPGHWVKNIFVLSGVFFGSRLSEPGAISGALLAFVSFCLASSAMYCLNDVRDIASDQRHPVKRLRPLAAGVLTPGTAAKLSIVLATASLAIAFSVGHKLAVISLAYMAVNALYSAFLKHSPLIDVFCISIGFILRILAGTVGIGVTPSQWLVLCTMLLSLFLGFSKRYAELSAGTEDPAHQRPVLNTYSLEYLRLSLGITLATTIMAYGLYTVSPRTVEVHRTENLVYTLPIVVFGLFRYLYLVIHLHAGEDTSTEMWKDRQLLATAAAYVAAVAAIFYFRI